MHPLDLHRQEAIRRRVEATVTDQANTERLHLGPTIIDKIYFWEGVLTREKGALHRPHLVGENGSRRRLRVATRAHGEFQRLSLE
jgi:hypothetical protein